MVFVFSECHFLAYREALRSWSWRPCWPVGRLPCAQTVVTMTSITTRQSHPLAPPTRTLKLLKQVS